MTASELGQPNHNKVIKLIGFYFSNYFKKNTEINCSI